MCKVSGLQAEAERVRAEAEAEEMRGETLRLGFTRDSLVKRVRPFALTDTQRSQLNCPSSAAGLRARCIACACVCVGGANAELVVRVSL